MEDIAKDIEAHSREDGAKEVADDDRVTEIDVDMAVAEVTVASDKPDSGDKKI